jgi:predicted transglutaminase-like cysteine proteinase
MFKAFQRPSVCRFAAALALVSTTPPALAATGVAKSEAILGAPSQLAAILAAQQGFETPKPAVEQTLFVEAASHFSAHRPDVFGSVALAVRRTPLDRRWHRVAQHRVRGSAAAYALSLRASTELDRLDAVNRYVNDRVQFDDDSSQYGRDDVWASAGDTLRRGRGDCEDYAIAKLQMLRAAGVADRDLYLVIARDVVRRADHALLVVRADGRLHVLDNGSDLIVDAAAASDYRPIMTFSTRGAWTHGYRIAAPVMMATATLDPVLP